jgi:DNA-directed RNA polymerase specialized sigma24 family protein
MLGSFQDAEDVLEETLLAAWQGLRGFDGRASLRTWLYRIATSSGAVLRRHFRFWPQVRSGSQYRKSAAPKPPNSSPGRCQ